MAVARWRQKVHCSKRHQPEFWCRKRFAISRDCASALDLCTPTNSFALTQYPNPRGRTVCPAVFASPLRFRWADALPCVSAPHSHRRFLHSTPPHSPPLDGCPHHQGYPAFLPRNDALPSSLVRHSRSQISNPVFFLLLSSASTSIRTTLQLPFWTRRLAPHSSPSPRSV